MKKTVRLKVSRAIRDIVRAVRFTRAENALAETLARKHGVSFSEWSRQATLKWRPEKGDLETQNKKAGAGRISLARRPALT